MHYRFELKAFRNWTSYFVALSASLSLASLLTCVYNVFLAKRNIGPFFLVGGLLSGVVYIVFKIANKMIEYSRLNRVIPQNDPVSLYDIGIIFYTDPMNEDRQDEGYTLIKRAASMGNEDAKNYIKD